MLLLLAVASLSIYPRYLEFFNFLSGGPGNGPNYLVDSNIDRGHSDRKVSRRNSPARRHTLVLLI